MEPGKEPPSRNSASFEHQQHLAVSFLPGCMLLNAGAVNRGAFRQAVAGRWGATAAAPTCKRPSGSSRVSAASRQLVTACSCNICTA